MRLPIEQGYILYIDAKNTLYTSDLLLGEATFLDVYKTVQRIDRAKYRIVGVFHTHPQRTHSLIPGVGDYFAAKDFDTVVGYSVNLLAVGGTYGEIPVVHFLAKKPEYSWDDFLSSPILKLHDALFPPPVLIYQLQITPTTTDLLRIYDPVERRAIDWAKKVLLARYFDITTVNLTTGEVLHPPETHPRVLANLVRVMRLYLDRFPLDLRRKLKATLEELYPDRPEGLLIFFRNTYMHFLEQYSHLQPKKHHLGHLRRSLLFRFLRVKDVLEEIRQVTSRAGEER
ncbi:MAG: hypothetical protein ACTSRS_07585 [Candidatus Helarchaeota archaeon]